MDCPSCGEAMTEVETIPSTIDVGHDDDGVVINVEASVGIGEGDKVLKCKGCGYTEDVDER